tara:strand:+ start:96 stop:275 length:180 start_codon:yes stop_codon:yes gene_type:complete
MHTAASHPNPQRISRLCTCTEKPRAKIVLCAKTIIAAETLALLQQFVKTNCPQRILLRT